MLIGSKFREKVKKLFVYVLLSVGAVIFTIPLFWIISTSLKPSAQLYVFPPQWIPKPFMWSNYPNAWRQLPSAIFFRNSFFYAGTVAIGTIISCSLVAFGFARLRFRGNNILFFILLGTMMIPWQVTMIPLYIFFSRLGWINTYLPLIVPAFFANAYFVFLLRQFFMTVPKELGEAAKLDGCSIFGIFWRIMLPLSKPALGIIAIFSFTFTWNAFLQPFIYLNDLNKYPISLGLRAFQTIATIQWQSMMAMSLLAVLPMLVIFFIAQKYYIQGIVLTGIKG